MLKRKLKECKKCHRDKLIWKDGMCMQCSNQSNFDKNVSFGMAVKSQMKRTPLKKTRKSKPKNKEFFERVYEEFKDSPVSLESGKSLGELGTVNMAHLMPKEFYKSVAHDMDNIIILSWEEHTRFDDLLFTLEFEKLETEFKCWSKICERFKLIIPKCSEEGKLKFALKDYLNIN
jgi:hypothetical protein